jgi:hypothetical protein
MSVSRYLSEERFLAFAIGFAPLLVLLLTWDSDGASSQWAMTVREYALPMIAIEGMTIGVASLAGLWRWTLSAPRFILAAVGGWVAVAYFTAAFVAVDQRLSLFLTSIWLLHAGFGAAVTFLCNSSRLDPRCVVLALMTGFIAYAAAVAAFGLQLNHPIMWVTDIPGLGNIRRVAAYATVIGGLSVGALAWPHYRLAFISAVAAFFTGFWMGSRATAPAIIFAVAAALVFLPASRSGRLVTGALAAVIGGFVLALAYPVEPGVGNGELRAVFETSGNGRELIWRNSITAIAKAPWLGHGEGQTAYALPDNPLIVNDFQAHPHNLFLQSLMAWGLIGFACLLPIAIWLAGLLYRAGQTTERLPLVVAAGALTVNAMVDGALYDVAPVFLFAACVGLACARCEPDPPAQN